MIVFPVAFEFSLVVVHLTILTVHYCCNEFNPHRLCPIHSFALHSVNINNENGKHFLFNYVEAVYIDIVLMMYMFCAKIIF